MENQIQKVIMQYLQYAKNVCWAMRANAGKMRIYGDRGRERWINMAPAGTSDIIGMLNGGKFFAIEVKTPDRIKETTELQREFINKINISGGVAFVATSIDDVINNLK